MGTINIIIYFKMKFFTLIALVGLTSAIRLEQLADPAHSGEAEVKAQAAEAHVDAPAAAADKKDPADDAEGKETPEEKAAAADKANGTEEKKEEKKDDKKEEAKVDADPAAAKAAEGEPTKDEKEKAVEGPLRKLND